MASRVLTKFTGVYERKASKKMHNGKPDICYDITYHVHGKTIWEKAGWKSEGYDAKLASLIRAERIRSIRHGEELPKEKRLRLSRINQSPIKPSSFSAFKAKYNDLYQDPQVTIPTIFDGIMQDIGLPVRFKDVAKAVREDRKKIRINSTLRMKILQRDNFTCRLCGRKPPDVKLHIDHIVPVSLGGLTEERNLQTLCFDCNIGKADKHFMVTG